MLDNKEISSRWLQEGEEKVVWRERKQQQKYLGRVVECWNVMYWVSKYHKRGTVGQGAASEGMENKENLKSL